MPHRPNHTTGIAVGIQDTVSWWDGVAMTRVSYQRVEGTTRLRYQLLEWCHAVRAKPML